eukprot:jgi/Botrbrau1/7598/Bobra.0159s0047.1
MIEALKQPVLRVVSRICISGVLELCSRAKLQIACRILSRLLYIERWDRATCIVYFPLYVVSPDVTMCQLSVKLGAVWITLPRQVCCGSAEGLRSVHSTIW